MCPFLATRCLESHPVEFEEFRLGLDDFLEVETSDEGLGPAFNATSCAVCHSVPAVGGTSTIAEVRAGRRGPRGEFIALDSSGESLFHLLRPRPCMPAGDSARGDDHRAARAHSSVWRRSGRSNPGRDAAGARGPFRSQSRRRPAAAAIVVDRASGERRVGRFGWKAQHATLLAFSADAYRNEMGITNDLFQQEVAVGISHDRMRVCDPHPEPEDVRDPRTGRRGIDNFASFMKFLAPIGRGPSDETVRNGERVFAAMGCATCHTPALTTAASANPLFNRVAVPLFSDLLLHDIGTGDGIQQESGAPDEIRTPALWGRFRRPLLHDGTAATIEDAISRHAGEATLAAQGYYQGSAEDRAALLAFLKSL